MINLNKTVPKIYYDGGIKYKSFLKQIKLSENKYNQINFQPQNYSIKHMALNFELFCIFEIIVQGTS